MDVPIFRPVVARFRVAFNALELVIIAIGEDIIKTPYLLSLLPGGRLTTSALLTKYNVIYDENLTKNL